jgi:hypothetical protein
MIDYPMMNIIEYLYIFLDLVLNFLLIDHLLHLLILYLLNKEKDNIYPKLELQMCRL